MNCRNHKCPSPCHTGIWVVHLVMVVAIFKWNAEMLNMLIFHWVKKKQWVFCAVKMYIYLNFEMIKWPNLLESFFSTLKLFFDSSSLTFQVNFLIVIFKGMCYHCPESKRVTCFCGSSSITTPCGKERTVKPPRCKKPCT